MRRRGAAVLVVAPRARDLLAAHGLERVLPLRGLARLVVVVARRVLARVLNRLWHTVVRLVAPGNATEPTLSRSSIGQTPRYDHKALNHLPVG